MMKREIDVGCLVGDDEMWDGGVVFVEGVILSFGVVSEEWFDVVVERGCGEVEEGEELLKMRILVIFCFFVFNVMNCCKGFYNDESKVLGFIYRKE